jgi:hypothetical protein
VPQSLKGKSARRRASVPTVAAQSIAEARLGPRNRGVNCGRFACAGHLALRCGRSLTPDEPMP